MSGWRSAGSVVSNALGVNAPLLIGSRRHRTGCPAAPCFKPHRYGGPAHRGRGTGYRRGMSTPQEPEREHDQDSEPPTPDGKEPDTDQLDPDSAPASDPDPDLDDV
jgi:hypothetical protein